MSKYEAVLGRQLTEEEKAKLAKAEGAQTRPGEKPIGPPPAPKPPALMTQQGTVLEGADTVEGYERHDYWHPGEIGQTDLSIARSVEGPNYQPPVYPTSKAAFTDASGNVHRINHPEDYDKLAAMGYIDPKDVPAQKAWFAQYAGSLREPATSPQPGGLAVGAEPQKMGTTTDQISAATPAGGSPWPWPIGPKATPTGTTVQPKTMGAALAQKKGK